MDLEAKTTVSYALKNLSVEECTKISQELILNTTITSLDLTQNSFGDGQCENLSIFIKNNTNLKSLDLTKNYITSDGCAILSNGLLDNKSIDTLNLEENNIGENGIDEILKGVKTSQITNLILKNTLFYDEGCKHIPEHLTNFIFLKKLNLDSNYISEVGIEQISEYIKATKHLESLSLVENPIHEKGCKLLFGALEKNTSLRSLNISKTYISNVGCKFVLSSLTKNKTLQALDISKNHITDEGAILISELLKVNTSLRSLNLSDNQMFDVGCQHICEGLKENNSLINLNLRSTFLSGIGCKYLYELLSKNNNLTHLNLSDNPIKEEGFQYISFILKENKSLYSLTLNSDFISDSSCQYISQGLENNFTLHTLDLRLSQLTPFGHRILTDRSQQRNKDFKEYYAISSTESPLKTYLPDLPEGKSAEFIFNITTRLIICFLFIFILLLISGGFALVLISNPSVHFVVIGGFGTNGVLNQTLVAATLSKFCQDHPCDFFLTTGDNFIPRGISNDNLENLYYSFTDVYSRKGINGSWYPIFGDRDYLGDPKHQLAFSKNNSNWKFKDFYYTFKESSENLLQRVDIQFFMIDTTPFESYYLSNPNINISTIRRQNNTVQIQWLNDEMSKSQSPWKIVFGHQSPYGYDQRGANYTQSSSDLVRDLVPILTKYKVQTYFAGHYHNHRYYEATPSLGYMITGAGSYFENLVTLNDPMLKYNFDECGFLYVSVYPAKMDIEVIGTDGETKKVIRREIN